jgi:hypothetical protein
VRDFLGRLCAAVGVVGVARVESEVSPSNTSALNLQLKQGFMVTSATNSERWGSVLRLTKFLNPESERIFRRQFCSIPTRTTALDPKRDRSRS